MKNIIGILSLILVFNACSDSVDTDHVLFDSEISFKVSSGLAPGENVTGLLAFDENNYFYSSGKKITQVKNSGSSVFEVSSDVLAIAWNESLQSLWFGTQSSGLGQLKEDQITYYTQKNNGLPRDLIYEVVCDQDGAVWFSSCAHMLGGLGCYRNGKFHFYTPENSSLPDNLIKSIASWSDKIFVSTGGTVTQQKVVTIEEGNWKLLPIQGYYLMDLVVDSRGCLYVIDDTGLSSAMMSNKIYQYKNGECQNILPQESVFYPHPYGLKTDLRNYLWVAQFNAEGKPNLVVYDGEKWHTSPDNFQQMYIRCIAADQKNNIWLGTSDGIYILNQ